MDALQFDGSSTDAFFGQLDHEQAYHLGGGRGQEQEVEQNYNAHQQYNDLHMNMMSEKYVHDVGLGRRGPPLAPAIMRPQHQHHEPPLAAALGVGGGLRDDLHEGAGSSASGLSSCAGSAVVDQFNTENFQAAAGVELLIHRGGGEGDESATPDGTRKNDEGRNKIKTLLESLMEREDSLTEGNADDSIDVMPPPPQQDEPGTGNNRRRVTPLKAQKLCEIVHAHILKHHSVSKKARLRGLLLSKGPMKDALQEIFLGGGVEFGIFQTEEMQRQVLEAVLRGRPQWFKLHSENSGNQVSVEALEYPTKASACSIDGTTSDDQQLKAKECTDHVLESKLQNNQLQINKEKETDTNKKAAGAHQLENRVEELRLDLMNQNLMKSPPAAVDDSTSAHHVHFLNQLEKMLAKKSQGWLLVDEIERREEYQRWAEKNRKMDKKKAGLVASTSTSASSKSTSISKLSELASSAIIGNAKTRFVVRPRDPTKPGKLRRLKDLRDEKQRFSRLKLGSAGASAKTRG
eukprot:g4470.t1